MDSMDPRDVARTYAQSVADQLTAAVRDGDRAAVDETLDRVAATNPAVADVFEEAVGRTSLGQG